MCCKLINESTSLPCNFTHMDRVHTMFEPSMTSGLQNVGKLRLKCDDTSAETRFLLSASPFESAGVSVQSTAGSRIVRISGSNAAYTTFRGSVKSTGYPLNSPVSPSLSLPCVTVCHHISTGLYHIRAGHSWSWQMIQKETRLAATAVTRGGVVAIIPNTGSEGQYGSWGMMFIARFTDLNFDYEISLCYDLNTMRQKHKYSN
jgi:hypothetical protein